MKCRAGFNSPDPIKGHCAAGKPHSFGAKPWHDVPAAASTLRTRLSRDMRARATALAFSHDETQYASFPRACAVPGGLWPTHIRWKSTAPAESLSPSVRDRGTTC